MKQGFSFIFATTTKLLKSLLSVLVEDSIKIIEAIVSGFFTRNGMMELKENKSCKANVTLDWWPTG